MPQYPFNWIDRPPSVNRIIGIKWVAHLLYPDLFPYDMRAETRRFYATFYHWNLTDAELNRTSRHRDKENTMNDEWLQPVSIRPVGVVLSPLKNFDQIPKYDEESVILMRGDLLPALAGLEHFSHLHVLYRQHRRGEWKKRAGLAEDDETLTMPNVGEPTCKGVYTSRSPARPSGIGSCVVELLGRDENRCRCADSTPSTARRFSTSKSTSLATTAFPTPSPAALVPEDRTAGHLAPVALGDDERQPHAGHARRPARARGTESRPRGAQNAHVQGGHFFAQGVEGITGCSVIHGSMTFEEKSKSVADWVVRADSDGRSVTIRMKDGLWDSASEVLAADDELLFQSVEVAVHALRG